MADRPRRFKPPVCLSVWLLRCRRHACWLASGPRERMAGWGLYGVAHRGLGCGGFAQQLAADAFPVVEAKPPDDPPVRPGFDHVDRVPHDLAAGRVDAEEHPGMGGADPGMDDHAAGAFNDVADVHSEIGEGRSDAELEVGQRHVEALRPAGEADAVFRVGVGVNEGRKRVELPGRERADESVVGVEQCHVGSSSGTGCFIAFRCGKRAGSWRERPVAHPESEDAARRPRDDPHLVGADETAEDPWVEPTRGGRVPASLQHGGGHDDTDYEGELAARQNRLPAPAAPWTVPRPAPRPTRTSCAAAAALAAVTTSTPPGRIPATRPYRLTR